MEVLGEGEAEKTKYVNVMRGKTKRFLKIVLDSTLFVQNTRFSGLE